MTDTPNSSSDGRHRAEDVVSEHLPSGFTYSPAVDETESDAESSLRLQGGDIHRDLYKIDNRAKLHQRSKTFGGPSPKRLLSRNSNGFTASEQLVPGGFRRQFLLQKRPSFDINTTPVTRNFVEFLDLYGSFAGEDLAESEDEAAVEDEESNQSGETRPLLGRRKSSKAVRKADAGTVKSFFTLLKAFVGTGIMFLPKAFNNGGILFSSITLLVVSAVTLLAFHLLLQCRTRYGGGGYGDLGETIAGTKMRSLILASITISQIGFVCAGIVFVAENLMAFLDAVTNGSNEVPTRALIAIQLVVLIPLAFIRNISKLGPAALLADIFILIGLTYIYYYDIAVIATQGMSKSVQLFNPNQYTLTIGAAIFTFEGIGLILPIQSSMRSPEKFEPLLGLVMLIITVIFTSVGALCYATFGSETKIEIIGNYPQDNKLVNAVQFLYSLAVLVGTPVQLFPAMRILEGRLFGHLSGKRDQPTKWKKNIFRTLLVILCGLIAIAGAGNLDRFVALIGSFACVPLVYIYPPYLHYRGVAESKAAKAGDMVFMTIGFVAMVYTTMITLVNSFLQAS